MRRLELEQLQNIEREYRKELVKKKSKSLWQERSKLFRAWQPSYHPRKQTDTTRQASAQQLGGQLGGEPFLERHMGNSCQQNQPPYSAEGSNKVVKGVCASRPPPAQRATCVVVGRGQRCQVGSGNTNTNKGHKQRLEEVPGIKSGLSLLIRFASSDQSFK